MNYTQDRLYFTRHLDFVNGNNILIKIYEKKLK